MEISTENLVTLDKFKELEATEDDVRLGDIPDTNYEVWTDMPEDFKSYLEDNFYDNAQYKFAQTLSSWIYDYVDWAQCEYENPLDEDEANELLDWALKQETKVFFWMH